MKDVPLPLKGDSLEEVAKDVMSCRRCRLYKYRKNPVPGEGGFRKGIMIIGEAPGRREDELGRPFVGKAGELLDQLLNKIGLSREDVYITNVVKCRPPNNRDPKDDEIEACRPFLERQIAILRPKIILCLGRFSARVLSNMLGGSFSGMTQDHGKALKTKKGPLLFFTYHPAAALYRKQLLEDIERDFLKLKEEIEKVP